MPDLEFENQLRADGWVRVAGVDEAGRGPLAGPVAAAAVVLPDDFACARLDDSKKLTAKRRDHLFEELTSNDSVSWALAYAEVGEIEELNILKATHLAMARAVAVLPRAPDYCLIDGLDVPGFPLASRGVVKGDGLSLSIAAASVIAKVSRDRRMREYAVEFPQYGFENHKGYGTKAHLEALRSHGPCRIHRQTFQPIAQLALPFERE
jgi:ribonuclease HII